MTVFTNDLTVLQGEDLFKQCLKEAWYTSHRGQVGEFDNLDKQDIASVLFKALHELDLIKEGELDNMHHMSRKAYKRKLEAFLVRWAKYCDNPDDADMYKEFLETTE